MRRSFSLVFLSLLLLAASGCSDDDGGSPDACQGMACTMADQGGRETGQPDTIQPDSGPTPDAPPSANFCGYLADTSGKKLTGADVIMCNSSECLTGSTGTTGSFCVQVSKADSYLFHAPENTSSGTHHGDVMFPLVVTSTEVSQSKTVDLGKVVVPTMGQLASLDAKAGGTLALGGGASLTVAAGVTTLPPLSTKADVALAQVAVADLHAKLKAEYSGKADPGAVFSLVPVETYFSTAASFVLPASGLTASDTYEIYWVNDKTGKLESHGEAQVSSSGNLVDTSGKGLKALGWFLFFKK